MNYDDYERGLFLDALVEFIIAWTNWETYENMPEESKRKYREKLTILSCYQFSPRKNFDISKDTIRSIVTDVIESNRMKVIQNEQTES